MRKILSIVAALSLSVALFAGCGATLTDGTYRAEFQEYDQYGWKDYIVIEIEDGVVVNIEADAYNEVGELKTSDGEYRTSMESLSGTYPSKYYEDLVNQYLAGGSIDGVDVVAGATLSTDNFKALATALAENMQSGITATVVIPYPTK